MIKTKTIKKTISVGNYQVSQADYPSECPICHHHSDIKQITTNFLRYDINYEVVFICVFQECQRFFIGMYDASQLLQLTPALPNLSVFPKTISKISPSFISIYSQAEQAETSGLDQIAGVGYRKAFEFLIKDYAKKISEPSEHKKIENNQSSSQVIDMYVKDTRIQAVAKRALWVGNDETHYLRKWEDKDIKDLINLIKLTVSWIEAEQISKEYIKDMP